MKPDPGVGVARGPVRTAGHTWRAVAAATCVAALALACERTEPTPHEGAPRELAAPATRDYITSAACRECHSEVYERWAGSHHDRAMEPADEGTVLGDFDEAVFARDGERWEFFREGERFRVRTEGADGARVEHDVVWTFGVDPLQQYLVRGPGGRVQALTVAWDSRPPADGGGRWFSLHAEGAPPPGDVVHWTGAANRWNFMCADCHSTDVRKNFEVGTQSYRTTFSDLDVGCEACHGAGAEHAAWARSGADERPASDGADVMAISGAPAAAWVMNADTGIAERVPPLREHRELERCAPCHARRSAIADTEPRAPFLDGYRPALLRDGLYYPDGQIHEEVYVYGSFLQSKMYAAGVTCSDCHDPHSLALRAEGDALCATCHAPTRFADESHHHHPPDSPGARCTSCHLPERTYMGVDARADHSFRVPRPDLSVEYGTPNACGSCHSEEGAAWAAEAVSTWFPPRESHTTAMTRTFTLARRGDPGAGAALRAFARLREAPAIARATALAELERYPGPENVEVLGEAANDPDPLVRGGAASGAMSLPPPLRAVVLGALLEDPLRSVRIEAARAVASLPAEQLGDGQRVARRRALSEYRGAQTRNADDPSAHVNLAVLARERGDSEAAERAYRRAIAIGDYFVPAYVNLADLYREQGRDREALVLLEDIAAREPREASVQHALGLVRVRVGEPDGALEALARAQQLAPDSSRYAYVYGVALHSYGQTERAVAVLDETHRRFPADAATLQALVSILRESGDARADGYAARLAELAEARGAPAP